MRLSEAGLAAVRRREGVRLEMYRDSAGLPTIGVGHLLTKDELRSGKIRVLDRWVPWHEGLSPCAADDLLRRDIEWATIAVDTGVTVALTQAQFDTLVSFAFNVGATAFQESSLLRRLNGGDYAGVPAWLKRWIHSAGQVDPVLVARRQDEIDQWEGVNG